MFINNYFFKQSDVAFKQSEVTNIDNSDIQDMISEETSSNIIEKLEFPTSANVMLAIVPHAVLSPSLIASVSVPELVTLKDEPSIVIEYFVE